MIKRKKFGLSLVLFLITSYAVYYFLTKKEFVCHIDSTTGVRTTISVRWFELSEHLDHGDIKERCELLTHVPDDSFEHTLIRYDYDDVLDDFVLTSNINTETNFFFDEGTELNQDVYDLTGIEDFVELRSLSTYGQPTEIVDLSNNINLSYLSWGYLDSIDLNNNVNLINLTLVGSVDNLDLTNNIQLEDLTLGHNYTPTLAWGINITSLDLTNNVNLEYLDLYAPLLTSLNLQNGNNRNLNFFHFLNYCPNLKCIQVDDAAWSTANWQSYVLPGTIFSEDCSAYWIAPLNLNIARVPNNFNYKFNIKIKRDIDSLRASFKQKVHNIDEYKEYRSEIRELMADERVKRKN